jgi:signal peptidase II
MMNKLWLIPLIAFLVLAADAVSKQCALANLHMGELQPFIPGVLEFTLVTNTGAAWGIGHEFKYLMILLPIAICAGIIGWLVKRIRSGESPLSLFEIVGYGMVIGGAAGNILERLYRGHVTDFLHFALPFLGGRGSSMDFPVFNVADSLIDVGVALIVLHSLFAKQPPQSNATTLSPSASANIEQPSDK